MTDQPLQALILDMDGVLADTEPIHIRAFRRWLQPFDVNPSQEFMESLIGHSVEENFRTIYDRFLRSKGVELELPEVVKERNAIYLELLREQPLRANPGVMEVIDYALNNNIKLGLATSSDREQVDAILGALKRHPDQPLDLKPVLTAVVAGDDVARKKPAPDIYKRALQLLEIPAAATLAVEDSQAGLTSAGKAGIACAALATPYNNKHKLQGYKVWLDNMYDLLDWMMNRQ